MIDLQLDAKSAQRVLKRINTALTGNEVVDALNAAAITGRAYVVQRVGDRVNLDRKYVDGLFSVRKATPNKLQAAIVGRARPVQLREFQARQEFGTSKHGKRIRNGVSVQVLREGQRKTIRSAFFIPLRGGNGFGIAMRKGDARFPVKVLYGPQPAYVLTQISPDVISVAGDAMTQQLGRQIAAMAADGGDA